MQFLAQPPVQTSDHNLRAAPLRDLPSMLWYPDIPAPELKFPAKMIMRKLAQFSRLPISLAIFGGSRGEHLDDVRGIQAYLDPIPNDNFDGVKALEVTYINRYSEAGLGPEAPNAEDDLFFAIDGPGGERIQRVDVIEADGNPRSGTFRGFMVSYGPACSRRSGANGAR